MRTLALTTLVALANPAFAEDLGMDTMLGTTMEEVTTSLTNMGYEVRNAEMEDGKIEVYFVKDKTRGEVYVDPKTGKVTKLEMK
ncbi:PepSY domain-containing protein [Ruegeria sediminis]|uniref:PepSY domain-containing protein n=1 Tax=Ruegeria sediminis TaxID=2583820 RepID=A0ABY2X172_9RHOB|nr:PepSY domain-containing protein [Ruegeria sediminis]TMV08593.1 PepSY domain-containing protein [Ruegeria sediminis]